MSEQQDVMGSAAQHGSGDQYSGGFDQGEDGDRVAHGMGQSKSSRRRRRKRKGKAAEFPGGQPQGGEQAAGEGHSFQASTESAPPSQPQAAGQGRPHHQQRQQGFQNNGQQFGGQAGAPNGTKRWKKKFRDRDRRQDNFGNQQNGGGQQQNGGFQASNSAHRGPDTHQPGNNAFSKRNKGGFGGKQRNGGSRNVFLGPMDHSYRPVNGNVFDASPAPDPWSQHGRSQRGGFQHSSEAQPIDYSQGRAVPIAEDAPTRIYFFIDDLFFTAKINETSRKLGVKVAFIKNEKEQLATLLGSEEDDRPGLIVVDLNNANAKPMTLIPKLKAKLKKSTSIIGFLSHLQGDLKAKAIEAGCDTVMPRAAFSQNLPNLLRRYGIEEVDEPNYNQ